MTTKRTPKEVSDLFVKSMNQIARDLDIPAGNITLSQFSAHDSEDLTSWQMRCAGGFTNLKKMYFPREDNVEMKHGSRLVNNFRNRLEKEYGQALFVQGEILKEMDEILEKHPLKFHAPITDPKGAKKKKTRTLVCCISDTHFGANIDREELNNANEYNWLIAGRRLGLLMDQVCDYKPAHREETDLIIQLNGDIIAGQIHNQEWFVDVLTDQFAGTLHLLGQAISYVAQRFGTVTVECSPGNHGRNVGKADKGRATTHKWDSYETMIYIALSKMMEAYPNVTFNIPKSPYTVYAAQGNKIFQTHGDTVINVGNPGKSISMDSINAQVNKVNMSDVIPEGEKIEVVCVGHVHVPTVQLLDNGAMLVINGCLSGVDPFAQSIGIYSNNPTQVIFESTEAHPVGDIRMVRVKYADKEKKYDAIISPYVRMMDSK